MSDDREWMIHAACRGVEPEQFFPKPAHEADARAVIELICGTCPVVAECAGYAMGYESSRKTYGIYGAMTAPTRSHAIRARKASA